MACRPRPGFDFSRPWAASFGWSHAEPEFPRPEGGWHFLWRLDNDSALPKCDLTIPGLSIMFNRDWLRNIWHRVANDIYHAFLALKYFGLEQSRNVTVVHIDWASKTFEELYRFISDSAPVMDVHALPANIEHICFEDVMFIPSRFWGGTWPEGGRSSTQVKAPNPKTIEFGEWLVERVGLKDVMSSYLSTEGKSISVTWITRRLHPGYRVMVNEDEIIEQARVRFGPQAVITKVDFDKISILEQIRIARATDILVGAHGAGLTHILWLPSHAVVLETIPSGFDYPFYERVAHLRGLRHLHLQSSDRNTLLNCTWEPHTKFCNMRVEVPPMLELLSRCIKGILAVNPLAPQAMGMHDAIEL